jgi:hypothetical protein
MRHLPTISATSNVFENPTGFHSELDPSAAQQERAAAGVHRRRWSKLAPQHNQRLFHCADQMDAHESAFCRRWLVAILAARTIWRIWPAEADYAASAFLLPDSTAQIIPLVMPWSARSWLLS